MNRSVDIHQSTAWWRSHRAPSRCTAGSARRQRSGRGGKRVAWATPICVALALPPLQPDQKAHGQHHCDRMPVKARPQPALILVPAQFLFGLLMQLLDGVLFFKSTLAYLGSSTTLFDHGVALVLLC